MRGKKNGGLKYEYTLSANSTLVPVYYWQLGDWAACSATCGGGKQRRLPICIQENKGTLRLQNSRVYSWFTNLLNKAVQLNTKIFSQESLTKKIVGRMQRVLDPLKRLDIAMRIHVLRIGG